MSKTVKRVVAVASGKGGVGKSTVTANLSLALSGMGLRVGVLDADIYGPSQPQMLGATSKPESVEGNRLKPVICHGVQTMSIGYLIEADTPMIWRGPMVSGALVQLFNDTCWEDLDYLLLDLPPGTGDIQLTMAQKLPVDGAVVVTTPQDLALLDVQKAIGMFNKVNVPVLGIVENMSTHVCEQCGHEEHIFGQGGGQQMAEKFGLELLGSLPLDRKLRENMDRGTPSVLVEPEGDIAQAFQKIAKKVHEKVATLEVKSEVKSNMASKPKSKFPKVVVEA